MNQNLDILIEGCKAYDRLSQEKLYQFFYNDLLLLCSKFFDDEHDIITAMNNGMLNVFNTFEKYNAAKGDIKGWVYIIVRNAAISFLRQNKQTQATVELHNDMQIERSVNIFKEHTDEVVYTFLKSLPLTTRAVINLFYVEDFMIKDIAIQLKMKEGTVKWHLNEGRNKLKFFFANNKQQVYANE